MLQPSLAEQRDAEDFSEEEAASGADPSSQPVAEALEEEVVSKGQA